jgi:hypothetical protein
MMHVCNSSTWEAQARGSQVQFQPVLHSEILSPKKVGGTSGSHLQYYLAEIRRIEVQTAQANTSWDLISKTPNTKTGLAEWLKCRKPA